jgi:hypothetical protein
MLILCKKQLNKAYKKRLKFLNKTFFKNKKQGINLFEEYLKYLRDYIFITSPDVVKDELVKTKIATINTAVAELESWRKTVNESKKDFHWDNFCELLKLNMKEWLVPNDSV